MITGLNAIVPSVRSVVGQNVFGTGRSGFLNIVPLHLRISFASLSTFARKVRIGHSDGQGHGTYDRNFLNALDRATHLEQARTAIKGSFFPNHIATQFKAQTFLGDNITAEADTVEPNGCDGLSIRRILHKGDPKKPVATGYLIGTRLLSKNGQCNDQYIAEANSYRMPKVIPPQHIIGHEVKLNEDESKVFSDQIGSDGMVSNTGIFTILHTLAYEKGIMEGTGEGFESKNGKPVMADSSVVVFKALKDGDKFRVFVSATQDEKNPYRYGWTGTLTNEIGKVLAIADCNHALLGLDEKPKKDIKPEFSNRLQSLITKERYDLFERGIFPNHQHLTTNTSSTGTRYITINVKGQPTNVVTESLLDELVEVFNTQEPLVLQSGRDMGFVLGADIKDFAKATDTKVVEDFSSRAQKAFEKLSKHPNSTAVINGFALGGGLELAMAAKSRVATKDAKLGLVETLIGVIPAFDGFKRLTTLVGAEKATRLIVSGDMISAEKAKQLGIVDAIVTTREDITQFVTEAKKRDLFAKHSSTQTVDPLILNKLDKMKDELTAHRAKQLATLEQLKSDGIATTEQAANIGKWMDGVYNARLKVFEVMKEQLGTKDPQEKSDIERKAFIERGLDAGAKFATQFWVLEKKTFAAEHKIIAGNPILQKSGVEIDFA